MIRTIEFRAKYKKTSGEYQVAGSWQYWSINFILQAPSAALLNVIANDQLDIETLGQYTGLKDRHGTQIYEGDILIYWYKEYPADKDRTDHKQFKIAAWNDSSVGFNIRRTSQYEIIGNVYDNPELLK